MAGLEQATKRCLVVGGGLLGGHTACALAHRGHSVVVYSRSFNPWLRGQRAAGIDVELVDGIVPGPDLEPLMHGSDVVFCFAGLSTPALSAQDPAASAANWLVPTVAVLELARRASVPRVVVASSGGAVYGRVEVVPTPESHATQPISAHGANALAIEMYASFFARVHGIETVVLRYSTVYGPGERLRHGQGVITAWCNAQAREDRLLLIGDGEVRRDFLFARDAASAAVAAADSANLGGVYNVGSGESWSLNELIHLLGEVSGREPKVESRAGRPVDVPKTALDTAAFREDAGWCPAVSMREGLSETWEWVRSSGGGS